MTRKEAVTLAARAWDNARTKKNTTIGDHWEAVAGLLLDTQTKTAERCAEIAEGDHTQVGTRLAREIRMEFRL